MKHIKIYINERLHITTTSFYTCHPKTKEELLEIIIKRTESDGSECDLNDIDVSNITDMENLFNATAHEIFKDFNGDVSMWNVSNVTNMYAMFAHCKKFNCNISHWNVSNVKTMRGMFFKCNAFNIDLSKWNMKHVEDIQSMFEECKNFNQNIDRWNVSNIDNMFMTFNKCPTHPEWYDKDRWENY